MNSSMESNNTETAKANTAESLFVGYYPLALIIVGTILNSLTFIILTYKEATNRSLYAYNSYL
jgi:hypothetical protein